MSRLYRQILRPLLFRTWHGDAELIHDHVLGVLARGSDDRLVCWALRQVFARTNPRLEQQVWGLRFPNPVGLAAGFDKNARAPGTLAALGFGHVELGTVTAHAQPGNERPRLFRLREDEALINRMGFNNEGARSVAERLAALPERRVPLGVSLGKSKITPIEDAAGDYAESLRLLYDQGDYFAVNVSSPNTPNLRTLQDRAHLERLLARLSAVNAELADARARLPKPVLVKVAPDLSDEALAEAAETARAAKLDGLIATNTTLARGGLRTDPGEPGGLSGPPLHARAVSVVRLLRELAPDLPIIGAGGIRSARDAADFFDAGAQLVQLYTGLVYEGPSLPGAICRGLLKEMESRSHARLAAWTGAEKFAGAAQ